MRTRVMIGGATLLAVGALAVTAAAGTRQAEPIKLFVIAPVATPIQNFPEALAGAQAAADAINKRGGIKGRKIEIGFCNTRSNANQAVACARQAVAEKALAVVGHTGTLTTLEVPILQQARIPDIGINTSGNPIDWTNPNVFPLAAGATGAYLTLPGAIKRLGKKRLAIVYQDVPASATNAKLARNAARTVGLPVVGSFVMPGATTDFAPFVQRLRELNADAVMFITSPGVSGGLLRAATSFGVRPLWAHNANAIGETEIAQIGAPAEGMLIASMLPTFRDTNIPAIRRFVAEMKASGKASEEINLKALGINSWLAVYSIEAMAKKMKGSLTSVNLLAALRAQKAPIDLQGLVQFAPGLKGPAAYPRWRLQKSYFLTVKNGREVAWGAKLPPVVILRSLKLIR